MNGSSISFRKIPSVALTSPITTAAASADPNPSTSIPGTIFATINSAIALRSQCISQCRTIRS